MASVRATVPMDILSQRLAPQRPEVMKIREKYKQENEALVENRELATDWYETMKPHNATQRKNVIGMARAVAVSAQAGAIDYRVTPVDEQQTSMYADRVKKLQGNSERKDKIRREISAEETKDRQARLKHAEQRIRYYAKKDDGIVEPGTFLKDWLEEYGRPKRVPAKEELQLTYNRGPLGIIRSCSSRTTRGQDALAMSSLAKLGNSLAGSMTRGIQDSLGSTDPLVRFETTRTNANSYRRGRLAD
jgi:hypothetical protein